MDYIIVGLMFVGVFAFTGAGLHFGSRYIDRVLGKPHKR